MFTVNSEKQSWLAESADVELYVGGKYELFWDANNRCINSTIGCKITAIEDNKLLCFERFILLTLDGEVMKTGKKLGYGLIRYGESIG